jgi:hypothetical protein
MQTQTRSVLAAAWLLLVAPAALCSRATVSPTTATATTHVFRCGDHYQSHPCQTLDANSRIVRVADTRTSAQIRAAFETQKKDQRDMRAVDKAVSKRLKALASKPRQAIGLNCRQPGARPFEDCHSKPLSEAAPRRKKKKPKTDRYLAVSEEAS